MNFVLYNVSFPKLDIFLKINPIAFKTSFGSVYWYGVIIATAFLVGTLCISFKSKKFNLKSNDISDFVIISSMCGIIGARIYYIIFYPGDFYIKNPLKILMISEGGIAIYGAIIGGALGVLITSKIKKQNVIPILDLMSLGLVIGQAIGRWGNFVNQEAFGIETSLIWGMASEKTLFKTVHPCFLYESLGCLIIFILLNLYVSKKTQIKQGNIFLIYTMSYGLLRAIIEGLRTDSLIIPETSVRISQFLALLLFIISLILLLKRNLINKKYTNSKLKNIS